MLNSYRVVAVRDVRKIIADMKSGNSAKSNLEVTIFTVDAL